MDELSRTKSPDVQSNHTVVPAGRKLLINILSNHSSDIQTQNNENDHFQYRDIFHTTGQQAKKIESLKGQNICRTAFISLGPRKTKARIFANTQTSFVTATNIITIRQGDFVAKWNPSVEYAQYRAMLVLSDNAKHIA
jgi:hypothetical protein